VLTWDPPVSGDAPNAYVAQAGSTTGAADVANVSTGSSATILTTSGVASGIYFVRILAVNYAGLGQASNEIVVTVRGGSVPLLPGAPETLTATITGSTVTLAWARPSSGATPIAYVIEAGSSPGSQNLANVSTDSAATTFTATGVAAGSYYVRVRADVLRPASNEVLVIIGSSEPGACTPGAPSNLAASVNGSTVVFSWSAPGGPPPTSYILEAGSASRLSNLASRDLGSTMTAYTAPGVPSGQYFVRVRSRTVCGTGGASNEILVRVGVPIPSLVFDAPDPGSRIALDARFRWHIEDPLPGVEYRSRIFVDKGVDACDQIGEAVYDAGARSCLTIQLGRFAFGHGESAAFAIRTISSTGSVMCIERYFTVDPALPTPSPDPSCPLVGPSPR
jgi:hypothetical protein